jgi:hypothetical protein
MIRSGSTVRYQIAKHLAEKAGGAGVGSGWDRVEPRASSPTSPPVVVKVHAQNQKIESRLDPAGTLYAYSYRDIRDVFASLIQKDGPMSPADLRARARHTLERHEWFASRPRVLISRYEDWLGDLTGEIRRYEQFMAVELDDPERAALSERLSIDRQKEYLLSIRPENVTITDRGHVYDRDTLLHTGHITDGAVGKWAGLLSTSDSAVLHEIAGPWLEKHGYTVPTKQPGRGVFGIGG